MTNTESRTASTAHTPGPWEIGLVTTGDGKEIPGQQYITMGPGDDPVCEVEIRGRQARANARLIAAAPDMLAALKFALLSLEYIDKQHSEITGTFQRVTAIGLAREAIAKATGAVGDRTHDATPQTVS